MYSSRQASVCDEVRNRNNSWLSRTQPGAERRNTRSTHRALSGDAQATLCLQVHQPIPSRSVRARPEGGASGVCVTQSRGRRQSRPRPHGRSGPQRCHSVVCRVLSGLAWRTVLVCFSGCKGLPAAPVEVEERWRQPCARIWLSS